MKKLLSFVFALVLTVNVFANNENEDKGIVLVGTTKKGVVRLDYNSLENVKTSLRLVDANNVELYRTTKKAPSELPVNFRFPDLKGESFTVIIENDYKVMKTTFAMENGIAKEEYEAQISYKPLFRQEEGRVHMSIFNPNQTDVTINVYNDNGEELVETINSNDLLVKNTFNFEQYREAANVCVKVGENSYCESVEAK